MALAIPNTVIWGYSVGGAIFIIGLCVIFLSGDWQKARGFDKLILFGPLFYAMPLAAFGTEHFTTAKLIASFVPRWIPWHLFWAYFVGTCFILGTLSMVTRIQARLSASLLALNFFLFVVLMDIPTWLHHPGNRFALTFVLRELAFCGGPLALAAMLTDQWRKHETHILATVARYFIAVPVLFYSFEQFIHPDHVPGVPLEPLTPTWIWGHAVWTYVAAVVYMVAGLPLLFGKKTRAAALWIGLTVIFLLVLDYALGGGLANGFYPLLNMRVLFGTILVLGTLIYAVTASPFLLGQRPRAVAACVGLCVLLIVLIVYVPIAVSQFASLDNGLNYIFDTLMFCGAVLLLAGAMPHETQQQKTTG